MLTHTQTKVETNAAAPVAGGQPLAFIVGQDHEGHWLAIETHGLGGGIFRSRDIAVHYARDECHGRTGAVRLVEELIRLQIS